MTAQSRLVYVVQLDQADGLYVFTTEEEAQRLADRTGAPMTTEPVFTSADELLALYFPKE